MTSDTHLNPDEQKEVAQAFRQFQLMVLLFIGMVLGVLVFLHTNTSFSRSDGPPEDAMILITVLTMISVSLLGVGYFFRRVLLHKKLIEPLAETETEAVKMTVNVYRSLYLTTWALGESIWVFALVLFFLGVPVASTYHLFVLALVHVWWLRPIREELESYMLLQKAFHRQEA